MKIVKLKGGLGNQMFQYAFAMLLRTKTNDEVYIDLAYFESEDSDRIRKPRIINFNTSINSISDSQRKSICLFNNKGYNGSTKIKTAIESLLNRKYYFEKNRAYIELSDILKYSYFDGYWQSWRYVDKVMNKLKSDFVPSRQLSKQSIKMIEQMRNENSIFIGVRKGDYSSEKNHYGSFDQQYYDQAMGIIEKNIPNPKYYIFSNDVEWVKNNIDFGNRGVIFRNDADIVDDFEELILMSECKHSIIINSTYHWWGARLNEYDGKIVIAPKNWFMDEKPIDIIPERWIKI